MNKYIAGAINEGYKLKGRKDLNLGMFAAWVKFSNNVVRLVCNNKFLINQYNNHCFIIISEESTIANKIDKCIRLLEQIDTLI